MKSFRNPKYLERYEDSVLTLNKLLHYQQILIIKTELILDLLLTIQEKPLHLIGIMQDYQLILK